MYKEFYQDSHLLSFPLFALLLFLAIFLLVVFNALRKQQKSRHDTLAQLPLADDGQLASTEGRLHVR